MEILEYLKVWAAPDPEDKPGYLFFLIIVLVTGMVIGFFIWKAWFSYLPTPFDIDFKMGQWITTNEPSPQGYFRKEFYLSYPVKEAWIKVGATDSYILYVNGKTIASENPLITNAAGIYDIRPHLVPGKNIIGVEVRRNVFPRPISVIIEGEYLYALGETHLFFSDSSWQESSMEESQDKGEIPWHSEEFNAQTWSYSQIANESLIPDIPPLFIHPELISSPIQGKWLAPRHPGLQTSTFYNTFEIPFEFQDAWIRIKANDNHKITINGVSPTTKESPQNTLSIFNVTPFLKKGENTIEITITALKSPVPRLIIDGFLLVSGEVKGFLATDSTWKAIDSKTLQTEYATIVADYSSFIDALVKQIDYFPLSVGYALKQMIKRLCCILFFTIIVFIFWVGSVFPIQYVNKDIDRRNILKADAIFHLPVLVFLAGIYLLQYDIRFTPAFSFHKSFIIASIIMLLSYKMFFLIELNIKRQARDKEITNNRRTQIISVFRKYRKIYVVIAVFAIGIAAFSFRLQNSKTTSLSHDEINIAAVAQEVLKNGSPIIHIGPIKKPLTTYELLPYPIILSILLLGETDFAVRLPSVILGSLLLLFIFYMGYNIWGIWTGLLAAAIYAFLPYSILWGSNSFHPQQAQFFTLLTAYLFYKAIHSDVVIHPKYMCGASICFLLTYLTWEGSGLFLLALFFTLLERRRLDFSWIKSKVLWICICCVGMVVLIQLAFRTLTNAPYMMVGQGLSGQVIKLAFLDPLYNGWYYFQNYLFSGNHFVLTLLILAGILFAAKDKGIRFCLIILMGILIMFTNFLPNASIRYVYFVQPFLVLPAAAIVVHFCMAVYNIEVTGALKTLNTAKGIFIMGFTFVILSASGTLILKTYELGFPHLWIAGKTFSTADYREANQYLKMHRQSDDIVISLMPHTVMYYTGQPVDYYLQAYTSQQLFYVKKSDAAGYIDKYSGSTVIRNIDELRDVLNRHPRVWIMAMPYEIFQNSNDQPIIDYIRKNTKISFETFKGKIFLWTL